MQTLREVEGALDGRRVLVLRRVDEGDDETRRSCAAGAAGTVLVVLVGARHVVVEHDRHGIDVDAARGDVGRDERRDLAGSEALECALSLALRAVAVDRCRCDPVLVELLHEPVRTVLRAGEHDRRVDRSEHVAGEATACVTVGGPEQVADITGRGRLLGEGVPDRIVLVALDQRVDVTVERRGEQQRLATVGGAVEQTHDLGQEPHVGHAVRLVEDDDVDGRQVDRATLHEVGEAARRGDEDVDATAHRAEVTTDARPAVDRRDAETACTGEREDGLCDLTGELAGREQDQGTRTTVVTTAGPQRDRDRERERLAGAGRRLDAQVGTTDRVGEGERLHGERRRPVHGLEGEDEVLGHAEGGERRCTLDGCRTRRRRACSGRTSVRDGGLGGGLRGGCCG